MPRLTIVITILASAALSPPMIRAEPLPAEPRYVGERSSNPEQETYAWVVTGVGDHILVFSGPARTVGTVTGDPEKDTVAYKPFLIAPQDACRGDGLAQVDPADVRCPGCP
ncbi:MAG: hypothetical protein ACRC67_17090 [Inquilinus sp.]|uniref:hypothetical protein n=1 Tax=Inquilinus sp. TaxID=1932117 RepID=UPI003F32E07A